MEEIQVSIDVWMNEEEVIYHLYLYLSIYMYIYLYILLIYKEWNLAICNPLTAPNVQLLLLCQGIWSVYCWMMTVLSGKSSDTQ